PPPRVAPAPRRASTRPGEPQVACANSAPTPSRSPRSRRSAYSMTSAVMASTSVATTADLAPRADSTARSALCHARGMRIGVALPNYGALAGRDTLARLAGLAEDLGADGVWVSDHLVAPVGATSVYPYGHRQAPA